MTEEKYSELHNLLNGGRNPWTRPQLWQKPDLAKARWRRTVQEWIVALHKVERT